MLDEQHIVEWFRASTAYINAHREKIFVVHLPGDAIAHSNFSNIVHDLTLLHSLGVKLVLVHGARPQISAALAKEGHQSQYHGSLRITDESHMDAVKKTVGSLTLDIQASFSMGLSNSPMHGANISVSHGNYVTAQPLGIHDGIDYQYTGKVRKILTDGIRHSLDGKQIVLISNLGYSLTGEVFNLSAEEIAAEVAIALNADKLILFTPGQGILDAQQQLVTTLNAADAEAQLSDLSAKHDQESELLAGALTAALRAYQQRVHRSHLISYEENGALLLELFTRAGHGTLLSHDNLDELRPASINDVGGILNLIKPLEDAGTLVERSRELLETEISNFIVIELEDTIIGCAALYPLAEASGEIACIAIHPDYQKDKMGERLLLALEAEARKQDLATVYALTTVASHFFLEKGFSEINVDDLPQERQALYNYQRKSKVFLKQLSK